MRREFEWGSTPERQYDMQTTQAAALIAVGKLSAGRALLEKSWVHSLTLGLNDHAAYSMAQHALAQADFGNLQPAAQLAEAALKTGHGVDAEEAAAEALAFSGDVRGSGRLIE